MNNTLKYTLIGILFFVLAFFVALSFFSIGIPGGFGCGWNRSGGAWGMGPGMMGGGWGFPGMMGGFGLFSGLLMLGRFLYPLIIISLAGAGIYWLVKILTKQNPPR